MSSDIVIRVSNLGKKYQIRHQAPERYTAFRDVIARSAAAPFRRLAGAVRGYLSSGNGHRPPNNHSPLIDNQSSNGASPASASASQALRTSTSDFRSSSEDFWALRDVSFEVRRGEVLGIIGRNGAGKSTLLKILSGITEPSEGCVTIGGRVASLLEVGTGFHPELTGRENIYLNGAILGMTRAEIQRKFDEIVDFAEVEKFLDTPVKRYSSGMYVRLAFAVAAHLEPEILVVDEVLAVGDVEFQKKCLGRMSNVASGGRTVLFVSHYLTAVRSLCSRALLLQDGRIRIMGEVERVADHYLSVASRGAALGRQEWDDLTSAPGNGHIRVRRVEIVSDRNGGYDFVDMESPFQFVIEYWNLTRNPRLILNLYLFSIDGTCIFESLTAEDAKPALDLGQSSGVLLRSSCFIPASLLNQGGYFFQVNFLDERLDKLFDFENCARVSIHDVNRRDISTYGRFGGYVHPKLIWRTEVVGNET